ncbi:MAG: cytochrome c3 family protein [bacterium]
MKKSFWIVVMVLILICVGSMVLQAGGPKVADDFKINSDAKFFGGAKKKAPPAFEAVPLSHKKHADMYGCKICHHKEMASDEPAEQAKAKKCSSEGCHGAEANGEALDLENAMHKQCYKDCHKNDAKAKEAKAPFKCGDCHKKADK